jgi:hypothetical protein
MRFAATLKAIFALLFGSTWAICERISSQDLLASAPWASLASDSSSMLSSPSKK